MARHLQPSGLKHRGLMVDTGATSHIITDIRKVKAEVNLMSREGERRKSTLRDAVFIPTYPQDDISVKAVTTSEASVKFKQGHDELIHKRNTDSEDTELLVPEVVENSSEDKYRNKYRIFSPHAGLFRCKFTNLMFEMEEKWEVLYRLVSWDSCVFNGLGQKEPAGPLYSIKCLEGSIRNLHLPHCETHKDAAKLTVAHVTDGNVEIIQPLKVTDTHVIIDIQGLSHFGLLKALLFPAAPIRAQVLLFYNKRSSTLYIHLLPENVPVEEVQKKHQSNIYIMTSSNCQLTPGKIYRPCCKSNDCDYKSQPEDNMFYCDNGPNYHPTFVVIFSTKVNKVTLSLLDEKGKEVWRPRAVLLKKEGQFQSIKPKSSGISRIVSFLSVPWSKRAFSGTDTTGADFVDQHRHKLIERVSSVMEIADCLKSKGMISEERYSEIHAQSTSHKQMRLLFKSLNSVAAKAEFYNILKEKEPYTVEELESGSRPA